MRKIKVVRRGNVFIITKTKRGVTQSVRSFGLAEALKNFKRNRVIVTNQKYRGVLNEKFSRVC